MGRGVRVLVTLVVAGMLALTGCAGQNPSHAATVNGVVITEDRVNEVALGIATAGGSPEAAPAQRNTAAGNLIRNQIGLQVGQQLGVEITDADVEAAITGGDPSLAVMAADPALTSFIHDYVGFQLLVNQMGPEEFLAASEKVAVNLNPRYGTWDPTQVWLSGESGSLSIPAPNTAPNA